MDQIPLTPDLAEPDPLAVLRSPSFLSELRRKAIHLSLLVLPLDLLFEVLPWPRGRGQWTLLLLVLAFGALALDVLRLQEQRVKRLFRDFLGGMLREHEELGLLGSTYLLLAALLAVDIFPRPVAARNAAHTRQAPNPPSAPSSVLRKTRLRPQALPTMAAKASPSTVNPSAAAATGRGKMSTASRAAISR